MKADEYYHNKENVDEYHKMAEGFDGAALIERLTKHLPRGSSVLELGMGPGKDLGILSRHYKVTGSDYSQIFLDNYQNHHPEADLLLLDAITLDTHKRYNGIFSNKVLMHLSQKEMEMSISRQKMILKEPGIMLHSFWEGSGEEYFSGLRFTYYSEAQLKKLFEKDFEILEMNRYKEMKEGDSIYLIAKSKI